MIHLRKHIHTHAEGGFKEFKTQALIKQELLNMGISQEYITECANTGLVVDIKGTAKPEEGNWETIAYRADIDALKMKEETGLEYQSITDHAHMCGHDGHIATLLGKFK